MIRHSYSKKGYPYDNASMESFNAILKKEEVNVNTHKTIAEARLAIFELLRVGIIIKEYMGNRIYYTKSKI